MLNQAKNNHEKIEEFREKFFNFLLRKPCTSGQAEKYLLQHDVPENFYNLLLDDAVNMGLIDDAGYAKLFIDGHLTWGNAKIIHELSARGIPIEYVEEALDDSKDEKARARELSEEWLRLGIDERKIINRLLNRGFSHSSIRACSKNLGSGVWSN